MIDDALFDAYLRLFEDVFPQANSARWAGVYLRGLLLGGGRKSIQAMAGRVRLPEDLTAARSPSQALHHLIAQCPWDEGEVLRRYRAHLAAAVAGPDWGYAITNVPFLKWGRHSVGVHRQYSQELGKKANCQVAVVVHHVGPATAYPLGFRLYLPEAWVSDPDRLRRTGVPESERRPLRRWQIALELLDRGREEHPGGTTVVTDPEYWTITAFREELAARGLSLVGDTPIPAPPPAWAEWRLTASKVVGEMQRELGLSEYEGRLWRGFHRHACLVMLAHGFRTLSRNRPVDERAGGEV